MPGLHPKEEAMFISSDRNGGVGPLSPINARGYHSEPQIPHRKLKIFLLSFLIALDWPFLAMSPFFLLGNGDVYSEILYFDSVYLVFYLVLLVLRVKRLLLTSKQMLDFPLCFIY